MELLAVSWLLELQFVTTAAPRPEELVTWQQTLGKSVRACHRSGAHLIPAEISRKQASFEDEEQAQSLRLSKQGSDCLGAAVKLQCGAWLLLRRLVMVWTPETVVLLNISSLLGCLKYQKGQEKSHPCS